MMSVPIKNEYTLSLLNSCLGCNCYIVEETEPAHRVTVSVVARRAHYSISTSLGGYGVIQTG